MISCHRYSVVDIISAKKGELLIPSNDGVLMQVLVSSLELLVANPEFSEALRGHKGSVGGPSVEWSKHVYSGRE